MTERPVPSHLRQVATIDRSHPWAPKILLVPRSQLGFAVEVALARLESGWIGWRALAPELYARSLVEEGVVAGSGSSGESVPDPAGASGAGRVPDAGGASSGGPVRAIPRGGTLFLTARTLEEVDDETRLVLEGPNGRGLVRPLARTLETLRANGVAPEVLEDRSDRQKALGRVLRRYESLIESTGFEDAAAIYRRAEHLIAEAPPAGLRETVVVIYGETELPGRAASFVRALEECAAAVYRVGAEGGGGVPVLAAVSRLDDWPVPDAGSSSGEAEGASSGDAEGSAGGAEEWGSVRFLECAGAETEVRAALRTILEEELPLEETEIAYTSSDPYLTLLAESADRFDLPLTVSTGRPALSSAPAQALRGFYDWITEDFDAAILVRLLRGGLIRLHRAQETGSLTADRAATLLAGQRYESGRSGYAKALGALENELARAVDDLPESGTDADEVAARLAEVRAVRRLTEQLLNLAPRGRSSVTEIAKRAERFLERFGPVDRPDPGRSETDWTDPEQDRQVLIDHLQALRDGPGHQSSVARIAARFRELLAGQYVRAERPEPGKAHVVPLEGAGYAGRRHLLVVGMDADSMEDPRAEDALLLDRDRERVADRAEVLLPLLRDRADESTWTAARALRRHAGTLVLTSRIFDVEAGEEVAPSSIFLRLRRAYGDEEDETPAGLVPPDPDEGLVLDDAEAWLGALRPDRSPADRPDARTIVEETYPWIRFGREASARRHSDVYTEYDGLLPDGPYPELDWLQGEGEAPSVSASRLELLAEAPYLYFLRYVLGVAPLEEPALEDEGWLDRATSGSVIHDALEGFMRDLEGRPPDRTDEDRLLRRLDERIDREKQKRSPPNEAVERAARRRLREDVRAFLRAEIARETPYEARYLELGFGLGPRRTGPGDRVPPVVLSLEEDLVIRLRGRIDRVDAYPDGSVRVWDYKTGSRKRFSESDALQGGRTAQWALYAAAVEELIDGEVDVRTSGYYFSSRRELGARLSFAPREYRAEVARVVRHLSRIARSGSFPMNLDARRWDYEDYDRICPDRDAYSRRLDEKTYPSDRPRPPHLQDD